jgi:cyclophilin family peptidyl-prolyl cis-trans isomerase
MGGSDETITGEFALNGFTTNTLSHTRGVVSMARSQNYDSASSQFFICNADSNEALDGKYAAFGYVVEGLGVVDEITAKVFPKTAYVEYYGDEQYYNVGGRVLSGHQIWHYYGNGAVQNEADKPIIEYIKVLDNYNAQ